MTAKRTKLQIRCQEEFKLEVEEFAAEEQRTVAEVMRSAFRFYKSRRLAERRGDINDGPTDGYMDVISSVPAEVFNRLCEIAYTNQRLPGEIGGTIITERLMPHIAKQGAPRFMVAADEKEPYKSRDPKRPKKE